MISLAILFLICLLLSGFFSGSEMAFVSANKLKMREIADAGDPLAQKTLKLYGNPKAFLTTVLIGNNVVNISATALLTYGLQHYYAIESEWLVTAIMAPLLVIFGEMVPKDYCRIQSQTFLLRHSWMLSVLSHAFHYPSKILLVLIESMIKPFGASPRKSIYVSEEEFRVLIEESLKTGVIEPHEKELINTILDFERIQIVSVMTPLAKVPKVEISQANVGEAKEVARRTQTKMLLVYEEDPALVVGMIYVFDLLFEKDNRQGLKSFLRSPIFLPQHSSIEKAFLTLQEKRQSFAVATDERSEAIGVVPIEKLLAL